MIRRKTDKNGVTSAALMIGSDGGNTPWRVLDGETGLPVVEEGQYWRLERIDPRDYNVEGYQMCLMDTVTFRRKSGWFGFGKMVEELVAHKLGGHQSGRVG